MAAQLLVERQSKRRDPEESGEEAKQNQKSVVMT